MEEGPDNLYFVLFGRFEHGDKRGEIKTPGAFNERPADSITDCTNIEIPQQFVIIAYQLIVLGGL